MKSYTKYWQNLVTIMILSGLMLFPTTARAAGSVVYEQAPNHSGGFGSDGPIITVADEFQFNEPTQIDTVTWLGGYGTPTLPDPDTDNFTIRLYADSNGQPGAVLQTFSVGNNAARTATGDFVLPPEDDFEGISEFQYSFDLPIPFVAEANVRYWLAIINIPSSDSWVWEMSDSPLYPGVLRSFHNGPWEPFSDINGPIPVDTAFQLQGSPAPALTVNIDIIPGSFPNAIHIRSAGRIPVAILSSATFDAPSQVDQATAENPLTFGRTGNEQSLVSCSPYPQDVNGDGLLDLLCSFATQAAGFQLGDIKGVLKGKTLTGRSLIGTDSVRIVP